MNLVERHQFRVLRSEAWGDAEKISAILLAVESARLPSSQLHLGPPVEKKEESKSFLLRHLKSAGTTSGPWIQEGRWMVEKERAFTEMTKLIGAAAKDPKLGLAVPAQLEKGFRKGVRVLKNEQSLAILHLPGFAQALWKFMDGKPTWLRAQNS